MIVTANVLQLSFILYPVIMESPSHLESLCDPFSPLEHRPQHLRSLLTGLGTGLSAQSFLPIHVPQFPAITAREAVNFLLICVNATPVFVVEIKPPGDFRFSSKRQEADLQLRKLFLDISPDLKIPVLHRLSVPRLRSTPTIVKLDAWNQGASPLILTCW